MTTATGPSVLDLASLACEVADGLVVRSVRDTHTAWLDRVHGLGRRVSGSGPGVVETAHRGIAGAVYGGLGLGLRTASRGSTGRPPPAPGRVSRTRPGAGSSLRPSTA